MKPLHIHCARLTREQHGRAGEDTTWDVCQLAILEAVTTVLGFLHRDRSMMGWTSYLVGSKHWVMRRQQIA